jgi:hypothetical protein
MAAEKGKPEVSDILLEWAKELLTPENISNEFLLARDDSERTAWHVAAKKCNTEL